MFAGKFAMVLKATRESRELVRNAADARRVVEAAAKNAKSAEVVLHGRAYTVVDVELVKR